MGLRIGAATAELVSRRGPVGRRRKGKQIVQATGRRTGAGPGTAGLPQAGPAGVDSPAGALHTQIARMRDETTAPPADRRIARPRRRRALATPGMRRLAFLPALLPALAGACSARAGATSPSRVTARPGVPTEEARPGLDTLRQPNGGAALVYLPRACEVGPPAPLAVLLHGAGGNPDRMIAVHRAAADTHGVVLVAPRSAGPTWDGIRGALGPDVASLDALLRAVFARCAIDPQRVGIAGFSDGATYALAVGRANGDLFRTIVAHSPGFLIEVRARGKPGMLVVHGTTDLVLPIEGTSRRIVPQLRVDGYPVDYREFGGGHVLVASFVTEGMRRIAAGGSPPARAGAPSR